jgi:acetylornithine deacetylase/succinyl-diaminopimelate desuccinylase-like protein
LEGNNMNHKRAVACLALIVSTISITPTAIARTNPGANLDATEPQFRQLYKELVETNTTLSAGDCTLAATKMAHRMKAAGFADGDLRIFSVPEHPKEGGLVATLRGSDPGKKAILLLAHLDVVEAKREDWARDPFTLIEEDGYFYARGAADDKARAAIYTDLLINYKKEGFRPRRDIKLALTCGEETPGAFNGAQWLAANHKDWIDAEFAINEGAGGLLAPNGNKVALNIQAGEKTNQNFILETTNPGGHSSAPPPENAIYDMVDALQKVRALQFPAQLNETTRAFFTRYAPLTGGAVGNAMRAIVADPNDAAADAVLSRNKIYNAVLRTTCVATMIDGGHAKNALPQKVRANVNCRIMPGTKMEDVRDAIAEVIQNPKVSVSIMEPRSIVTPSPKLGVNILKPIENLARRHFPNIPVIPIMVPGSTDGIYTTAAGIPTYGFSAIFSDYETSGTHGLNERVLVKSVIEARKFQYELIMYYSLH